jgi:hypothetical protein
MSAKMRLNASESMISSSPPPKGKSMHRSFFRTLKIAVVVAGMGMVTSSAFAASSYAYFAKEPWEGTGEDHTGEISANRAGHHITVRISPHTTWWVNDEETKKRVGGGTAGWLEKRKTISGLYGDRYVLYIKGIGVGYGYINDN